MMPDLQKLIATILQGSGSEDAAPRVYRDEPILFTAAQLENITPVRYRVMRKIARGGGYYYGSDADIFYQQAKFMENFEDDFAYHGDFTRYYPTYQSMSDLELRGYFSWRTKVRRGIVEKTSLSFVFVYIYELLNGIGVHSAGEGFRTLLDFWKVYREYDSHISHYVRSWLKDYVVYYNLDPSLLADLSDGNRDENLLAVLDFRSRSSGEVCAALSALSAYNLEESKFYKQHPDEMKTAVCHVFSSLADFYEKNRKKNIFESLFGRTDAVPYTMFRSAVFCDRLKYDHFVYETNDLCKYSCQGGHWTCERFFSRGNRNKQVGALLKNTDYLMRRKYGFKSALKPAEMTKTVWSILEKEVERFHIREPQKPSRKIEIDLSRLSGIRQAAQTTQEKLIVDDAERADAIAAETKPDMREPAPQAPPPDGAVLDDTGIKFLRCLLGGKPYAELLKSRNLLLSVLVDSINEALFDRFGDTVIDSSGDRPELIADYIDELKGIVSE